MIFLSSTTVSRTESEPNLFLARQPYSPRLPDLTELITELGFDLFSFRKSGQKYSFDGQTERCLPA